MEKKDLCVKDQEQFRVEKSEYGKIKIEIELPENYNKFFKYIELDFGMNAIEYAEMIIKNEIESRNYDLNLF